MGIYREPVGEFIPRVEFLLRGRTFPLEELYFCDMCSKICSRYELNEEIDSYYCPHCLENMPSSEAMLYLNRCSRCLDCPVCFNTLTIITVPDGVYYFSCEYCRWNSRGLGLENAKPDQPLASAFHREREAASKKEMSQFVETFRRASQEMTRDRELQARMRRRSITVFLPSQLDGRHGAGAAQQKGRPTGRWRVGDIDDVLAAKEQAMKNFDLDSTSRGGVPVARLRMTDLSSMRWGDPVESALNLKRAKAALSNPDTTDVASLAQRVRCVNEQAEFLSETYPSRKPLLTKRSHRCRNCSRFVVKPQINPCSTPPFQKQNVALMFIPRCQLLAVRPVECVLSPNVESVAYLVMTNPLDSLVSVSVKPLTKEDDPSCNVQILSKEFDTCIAAHNDLLDVHETFSEEESALEVEDDINIIPERQWNKILIRLLVKPEENSTGKMAKCAMRLLLNFKDRSQKQHKTEAHLVLSLGKVESPDVKRDQPSSQSESASTSPPVSPKK